MKGFTLVELLLVIALTTIVGVITIPISFSYFQVNVLHESAAELKNVLRTVHAQATFQKNDSAHGVKILTDEIVAFTGTTYATRNTDLDVVYPITERIEFSGFDEVSFAAYTGLPNTVGDVVLSLDTNTATVTVTEIGLVK